jgi:hypothetical protein
MKAWQLGAPILVGMLVVSSAQPAYACGGCFAPQGNPSVVNAHRMALLVSPRGSVLWDQIQYSGAPEDFVWVLPVSGTPEVQIADNGFFEALTGITRITMTAPAPPRTSCPNPCDPYNLDFGFGGGAAVAFSDAGASSVQVFHEGVVGPYETVTIGSEDPGALVAWLQERRYQIDDSIMPTIAYYVGLGMNFVALRLAPNAGVDLMQPVRVPLPGLALTIPLRMVAAGVGTTVDLELFVFAESRMQTANFPNAEVDRAAITYDWATRAFDYDQRFEEALFSGSGPLTNWVTEYAADFSEYQTRYYRSRGPGGEMHSAEADTAVVTAALPTDAYLTRLRTRLPPSQLQTDLTLGFSTGANIYNQINVTRELNRAHDPVCRTVCESPSGLDPSGMRLHGGGFRCGVVHDRESGGWLVPLALGLLATWLVRRRR